MDEIGLKKMFSEVLAGRLRIDEAVLQLKQQPFTDLGYAKLDNHRALRQGCAEVIYSEGKSMAQLRGICGQLDSSDHLTLFTRLSPERAQRLSDEFDLEYFAAARIGAIGTKTPVGGLGTIVVACAGTSDIPVAAEAATTAELLGNEVKTIFDVGVAGLHRLLSFNEDLMSAKVIIAVAGMEGALPSVIAGLVSCPVIAVPTSVGYGAAFAGVTPLLAMLNSCASGLAVVNIDNGFGAGYLANSINHITDGD